MSDGYIKKSDVLDALEVSYLKSEIDDDTYQRIRDMPSVAIPNKVGHWKKIESGDKDFPESIVCSNCGCENSHFDYGIGTKPIGKVFVISKFCPNCGCPMEIER